MDLVKNNLYIQIKQILDEARKQAYRSINSVMVQAYWNIGRIIVEEEQKGKNRAEYGKYLLKSLSDKLTADYGKGFKVTNLKYFRQFFLSFPKSHALRDQLSWTHYRLLMRVKNQKARDFYIEESISENWSSRALERQINSFYYERLLSSKIKEPVIEEAKDKTKKLELQPQDIIKDPTILEFLNMNQDTSYLEKELEQALIDKLQDFLLELGKGFCFVARQKRISTETSHFYIDLVFYNYLLKCFVLIDLKTGKLAHQDIGQMDMYVRLFENEMKSADDNPTIGIILCAQKDETIVKYSVLKESKQIFASKYQMVLPTEEEFIREIEREKDLIIMEKKLMKD
ncbi:MAG TPA: DUF1016 domain-containing protein [Candidatus Cloacimonetes bacterium]|nr:DUF1016 domain-containing protein [Candidatus Cloacimonadota bacterium]